MGKLKPYLSCCNRIHLNFFNFMNLMNFSFKKIYKKCCTLLTVMVFFHNIQQRPKLTRDLQITYNEVQCIQYKNHSSYTKHFLNEIISAPACQGHLKRRSGFLHRPLYSERNSCVPVNYDTGRTYSGCYLELHY